jgi:hypothetical protein
MKVDMARCPTSENLYWEVGTIKTLFGLYPTVETPTLFGDEFDPSCQGFAMCRTVPTDQLPAVKD